MTDAPHLDHIGIAVHDLGRAIKTYEALFGCAIAAPERLEARGIEVAFVGAHQPRLELLGAIRQDSEIAAFLNKRGEGVHHICMRVQNLSETVQKLESQGMRMVGGGIRPGADNSRVAFVHPKDAHGVLLELLEPCAAACAARADAALGAPSAADSVAGLGVGEAAGLLA